MKKIIFSLLLILSFSKLLKLFTQDWYPARHWSYLKYVVRHKWYVFEECLKLGVPLHIAILHDWDKFLPDEWMPYAETFYKVDGSKQYDMGEAFTTAWNHHQKRNKHHWQYWMITWDKGNTDTLPMPDLYRREMLADWRGAGRAINGKDNAIEWYTGMRNNMKLHPETRQWIEQQIGYEADDQS
ncbi:MAG: DUF5662 family protein [Anaerolineae bacterium]